MTGDAPEIDHETVKRVGADLRRQAFDTNGKRVSHAADVLDALRVALDHAETDLDQATHTIETLSGTKANPFEDYPLALQYAGTVVAEIGMAIQRTKAGDDMARAHREMAIEGTERLLRTLKRIKP